MKNFIHKTLLLSFFSAILPWNAWSACNQLTMDVQNALIDLNTLNGTALPISITKKNGSCNYFLVVDNGGAATYSSRIISHGGDTWPFQIYSNVGRTLPIKSYSEASVANDTISGSMSNGNNNATVNYYPYIDTSLSRPVGPYTGGFTFSLYEGDVTNKAAATLVKSQNVNYKYTKGSYADISLVDTGAAYNIFDTTQSLNFGQLATGANQSFDIIVDYNQGYTLQMRAPNSNGTVNRLLNTTTGVDYVNYTLSVNNTNRVLNSGSWLTVANGGGAAPTGGTRLPVKVTIGTVNGATKSGNYSETVLVQVLSGG